MIEVWTDAAEAGLLDRNNESWIGQVSPPEGFVASERIDTVPAPARILAFDILRRVETGAWASDLLLAHSAGIDSRDAGLASEIVFGVLRYRAQLDFLIEHYSGRRQKLDV